MKLTEEQKSIIRNILKFDKNIYKLGGFAGTGKSTVIKHLVAALPNFAVCAYTGKAASILRKKGIEQAKTIHSLIYKAHQDENNNVYFTLENYIDYEGIIVDESSMVSEEIYKDLTYFNKPIIFVGDHGQLEPIGDNKFNIMREPDFTLEKIHRNSGEIAHFAEYVRNGYRPSSWQHRSSGEKVKFVDKNYYKQVVSDVDQIICAFNKTRAEVNRNVRVELGKNTDGPQVGDKIICLRNNKSKGLYNGMQGFIGWFHTKNFIQFVSEEFSNDINIDLNFFNSIKYEFDFSKESPNPFDYAYAITCHKAQGDEFDKVLVMEQKCDLWSHSKWTYTAASRAKKQLYWCQ
jgi:exodeoxyribonuclease-5